MSMSPQFEGQDDVMSEINMTPLVDVMLVLLIIFILTMPVLTQQLNLQLPQASGASASLESALLSLHRDGQLQWNGQLIEPKRLSEYLQKQAALNAPLQIAADAQVPFERVAQALAAAQQAGISQLNVLTTAP